MTHIVKNRNPTLVLVRVVYQINTTHDRKISGSLISKNWGRVHPKGVTLWSHVCTIMLLIHNSTWCSSGTRGPLPSPTKSEPWCYSGFHHTRWITHCMAFPCPAADSLPPLDHFISFDVTLIIPKKHYNIDIRGFFPDNRVHTRIFPR